MKKVLKDIKWLFNYIASIIMYAIIVIFIGVGVVLLAYFVDAKRRVANVQSPLYGAYVIVSGSMEPIIKIKDAVITRRVDKKEDLKVGDVITYRSMDETYYGILITHRIIEIKDENGETKYITKGDHNETPDRSPITFEQVTGKVVMRIPKIGYLKYFLVSSYGWVIAIVIPSFAIIGYDIFKLVRNVLNLDKKNKNESKEV